MLFCLIFSQTQLLLFLVMVYVSVLPLTLMKLCQFIVICDSQNWIFPIVKTHRTQRSEQITSLWFIDGAMPITVFYLEKQIFLTVKTCRRHRFEQTPSLVFSTRGKSRKAVKLFVLEHWHVYLGQQLGLYEMCTHLNVNI